VSGPSRSSDAQPLAGYGVVVTRPRLRSASLADALRVRGASVILAPAVKTVPPLDSGPFRDALEGADRFDWIVFTSASAVTAVAEQLDRSVIPGLARIAVVGGATAAAARERGWTVEVVASPQTAEGLLSALEGEGLLNGVRVLLPLAEGARDILPEGLRERGARVTRVTAYRTVPVAPEAFAEVRDALESDSIDLLTFTSPSTAASFRDSVGEVALTVPAAVIGPVTGAAAEDLGYRVVAVAPAPSVDGLVAAVEGFLIGREERTE